MQSPKTSFFLLFRKSLHSILLYFAVAVPMGPAGEKEEEKTRPQKGGLYIYFQGGRIHFISFFLSVFLFET